MEDLISISFLLGNQKIFFIGGLVAYVKLFILKCNRYHPLRFKFDYFIQSLG